MSAYKVFESSQFLEDVEEAVVWVLLTNAEQSESFAKKKADELQVELVSLKERLQNFPESGESASIRSIRRFPIYGGRYSVTWLVNHIIRTITLISLTDSKYPKQLRQFHFDE